MIKMMQSLFELWESHLRAHMSYESLVFFEDLLIFLFGIFIGSIIMTFVLSRIFTKSHRIEGEKFGKISLIRFHDGNEKTFFINDRGNTFEAMRMLLLIAFSPWFTVKSYTKKDERRTMIFIIILIVLGVIISALAILSIITIDMPSTPPPSI